MKHLLKLSVIFVLLLTLTADFAFGHGRADRRNKCKNGKRCCIKTKVNGPGCDKYTNREKNCSSAYGLDELYKQTYGSCLCYSSPDYGLTLYWEVAAHAEALANSSEEWVKAYKTQDCKHYKAGGKVSAVMGNKIQSSDTGGVEAYLQANTHTYNYTTNTITFTNLAGYLQINSLTRLVD